MYLKENGTHGFYRRDYQGLCMGLGQSCLVKTLGLRLKNLNLGQQVCRDNTNQLDGQGAVPKICPKQYEKKYDYTIYKRRTKTKL